jgi:hypothetical protein
VLTVLSMLGSCCAWSPKLNLDSGVLQMKEKPSQMSYDWSKFKGSSEEPSEERSKKHDKVRRLSATLHACCLAPR